MAGRRKNTHINFTSSFLQTLRFIIFLPSGRLGHFFVQCPDFPSPFQVSTLIQTVSTKATCIAAVLCDESDSPAGKFILLCERQWNFKDK